MDTVYVICCNDKVEAAVLNDEKFAEQEIERLSKLEWEKLRPNFRHDRFKPQNYKEYRSRHYWHLHTVPLLTNTPSA
jgi:hypothetical protein